MAFSLISNTSAGSVAGGAITTGSINTTGATLLTVVVADLTSNSTTLSDNKSNTWQARTPKTNSIGGNRVTIYDCVTPTVGTGHTFTATPGTTSYPALAVAAWSGSATAPFDQQNGANDAVQAGSVTPTQNSCVVIQGITHGDASVSINSSYTISNQEAYTPGAHFGVAQAYIIQTTAAATNPTWTCSFSGAVCAVYKDRPGSPYYAYAQQ